MVCGLICLWVCLGLVYLVLIVLWLHLLQLGLDIEAVSLVFIVSNCLDLRRFVLFFVGLSGFGYFEFGCDLFVDNVWFVTGCVWYVLGFSFAGVFGLVLFYCLLVVLRECSLWYYSI